MNAPTAKLSLLELTALIALGDHTEEQMTEFLALSNEARNAKAERKQKLSTIRDLINALGADGKSPITTVEAISLFPAGLVFGSAKEAKGTATTTATEKAKKASDSDIELFFVAKKPNTPGAKDFSLHKGRIFEPASDKLKAPYPSAKAVPAKLLEHGNSEQDLMKIISVKDKDAAEAYLKTAEGKKEITEILKVVKEAKEKLAKKPATVTTASTKPAATPAKKTGKV